MSSLLSLRQQQQSGHGFTNVTPAPSLGLAAGLGNMNRTALLESAAGRNTRSTGLHDDSESVSLAQRLLAMGGASGTSSTAERSGGGGHPGTLDALGLLAR